MDEVALWYEVLVTLDGGVEVIQHFNNLPDAKTYADKCVNEDGAESATVKEV